LLVFQQPNYDFTNLARASAYYFSPLILDGADVSNDVERKNHWFGEHKRSTLDPKGRAVLRSVHIQSLQTELLLLPEQSRIEKPSHQQQRFLGRVGNALSFE
jgi:hypothetical protein